MRNFFLFFLFSFPVLLLGQFGQVSSDTTYTPPAEEPTKIPLSIEFSTSISGFTLQHPSSFFKENTTARTTNLGMRYHTKRLNFYGLFSFYTLEGKEMDNQEFGQPIGQSYLLQRRAGSIFLYNSFDWNWLCLATFAVFI